MFGGKNYTEVDYWVSGWFASKEEHLYCHGIHKFPEIYTTFLFFEISLFRDPFESFAASYTFS